MIRSCLSQRYSSNAFPFPSCLAKSSMQGIWLVEFVPLASPGASKVRTTLKFPTIRTLSALALTQPGTVSNCNLDMENLITDPNRSIATLLSKTARRRCSGISVSSSRIANSPSCLCGYYICLVSKDRRLRSVPSTFGTSITTLCWRMLSSGQLLSLPWPSSASMLWT